MSSEKDHVTLVATAANRTTSSDQEDPAKRQPSRRKFNYKRRCIQCCGCCTAMMAIAGVVLLAVVLTVYKVREPEMAMKYSISNKQMSVAPPNVNMTVTAEVSVKNHNPTTFYFDGVMTSLYHHDVLVGRANGPPLRSPGLRTFRMNVTVDVISDQLLSDPNSIGAGALTMNSSTTVGGHVMVFGLFRHHLDVLMNCTVTVAVANHSILNQFCRQRV